MKYELTIVLVGKITPAKKKAAKELIEKLVKVTKGKVIKSNDWGEKELASTINAESSGNLIHFELELEPESIADLATKLNLEESIARHLLVRADD